MIADPDYLDDHAAILFWLPHTDTLLPEGFVVDLDTSEPPHPNVRHWWTLRDALVFAIETGLQEAKGKLPWIKVGSRVLNPKAVSTEYRRIVEMKNIQAARKG